jgi:hypothetical protein
MDIVKKLAIYREVGACMTTAVGRASVCCYWQSHLQVTHPQTQKEFPSQYETQFNYRPIILFHSIPRVNLPNYSCRVWGSHTGDTLPCSPLKVNRRFEEIFRLHFQARRKRISSFTLVSCSAYSSTLKMEATCSSETSVDFHRTTRSYIPEVRTFHNHRCENLKSYNGREVRKSQFVFYSYTKYRKLLPFHTHA